MKVTIAYMNNATDADDGKVEFEGDMSSLIRHLNSQQFVRFVVRVPTGEQSYNPTPVLVNRDDIAQLIEGWFE